MAGVINSGYNVRLQNIIDKFPEELVLMIFDFLDLKSVKNMASVQKRWYNIVTNHSSTMKKLTLTIRGDVLRENHLIVGELSPKFHKVVFKSIKLSFNTEMLSKLEEIGSKVHEIEFIGCYMCEPEEVLNILRHFPEVEKLRFDSCSFRFPNKKSNVEVLKLDYLLELVLQHSCLMILTNIGAQLRSLKVNMPYFNDKTEEAANEQQLVKFLYTQKELETLALTFKTNTTEVFAQIENAEYQFKLKELSIHHVNNEERFNYGNLKDFLHTQKDSIEILEMGILCSIDIYELILNKFVNLKTLSINIFDLPKDLEIIEANKSVTKLIIEGEIKDNVKYCTFLRLFPNVTNISFLCYIPFEVVTCLPNCCDKITSLSLHSLYRGNYKDVIFPALKNLHLDSIVFDNGWKDLVLSNETIESLSFRFFYDGNGYDSNEIKTICEELPNLKHLQFAGELKKKMCLLRNIKKSIQISFS